MPDEKLTPKKMTDAPQIVEMDIAHSDSVAQLQIMAETNGSPTPFMRANDPPRLYLVAWGFFSLSRNAVRVVRFWLLRLADVVCLRVALAR
jgi:hypothetical protein